MVDPQSARRALITGITGQDGSYLAEQLLERGYEVHGVIRRSSSFNTARIDHLYRDPHEEGVRLFTHHGDLSDPVALMRLIYELAPDEIYNLGAQSHVGVSFGIPEYTLDVTAIGTLRLLDAVRDSEVPARIYQSGSSEMFGASPPPHSEVSRFYPRSPYAVAKLAAHWLAVNYREAYGMHVCNGILFNHESPRRGETFVTRKITRAVARIKAGLQEELYLGNLDARRDWGYAPDYTQAMQLMLAARRARRLRDRDRRDPLGARVLRARLRARRTRLPRAVRGDRSSLLQADRGRRPRGRFVEGARRARLGARGRLRAPGRDHGRGRHRSSSPISSRARSRVNHEAIDGGRAARPRLLGGQDGRGHRRRRVPRQADRPAARGPRRGCPGDPLSRPRPHRSDCRPRSDRERGGGRPTSPPTSAGSASTAATRRRWPATTCSWGRTSSRPRAPPGCRSSWRRARSAPTRCTRRFPFARRRSGTGTPRFQCPVRARQEDAAGALGCLPSPVRLRLLRAGDRQPLRARRQLRPRRLARDRGDGEEVLRGRRKRSADVTLWGTGEPSREFLYVEDAARGLLLCAERLDTSEPVNLGVGRETRIRDLAELIAAAAGYEGEIVWDESMPDGQMKRGLEVSKARRLTGFEAEVSLEDGIRRTVDWWRRSG